MADDLRLTDTQRSILVALCRPSAGESRFAPPATNQEIADELFLSVDAIKAHLRVLFRKFGIEELPHNQKRARLAELAIERGIVTAEGTVAEPAGGAGSSDKPEVVAVPAERAGEVGAVDEPVRAVPERGGPGRLIGAGLILGIVLVAALVFVLVSGGEESGSRDTREVVEGLRASCMNALSGAGPLGPNDIPNRNDILGVVETVREDVATLGSPGGDTAGLDNFSAGLDQASVYIRTISDNAIDGEPTPDTVFARLIIAAGFIQAGSNKFGLGPDCFEIGERVGRIQPVAPAP